MSKRRKAREVAIQLLYKDDFNEQQRLDPTFIVGRLNNDRKLAEFCTDLVKGVRDHSDEIDQALVSVLDNWKLERVAATDRNILRLGTYELLYSDTPGPVVINECIELARRFGNEQSHQFVNGILDRVLAKRSSNA